MNIDNTSAARFAELVETCGLSGKIYDYHYLSGLLLAVASAPDLVSPAEWLPLIHAEDEDPGFTSLESTQPLLRELIAIWNHWADVLMRNDPLALPPACRLEGEVPSDALSYFAAGAFTGYSWLEEDWKDFFDVMSGSDDVEKIEGIYTATLTAALQLAKPEGAREIMANDGIEPFAPGDAVDIFREGLLIIGKLGRVMASEREEEDQQPAYNPVRDIGRNDPCPCGSGKKYKKCCLV